jgi:hypothetical protein
MDGEVSGPTAGGLDARRPNDGRGFTVAQGVDAGQHDGAGQIRRLRKRVRAPG